MNRKLAEELIEQIVDLLEQLLELLRTPVQKLFVASSILGLGE